MVNGTESWGMAEGHVRPAPSAGELEQLNQAKLGELKQMVMNLLAEAKRQADSAPTQPRSEEEFLAALEGEGGEQWAVAARLYAAAAPLAEKLGVGTAAYDIFDHLWG